MQEHCVFCELRAESLYIYICLVQISISVQNSGAWLKWLVAGLSPRRFRFDPRPVHMRFVGKVALDRFFSEYFGFTLSVSFHQCSILIFIYTFLLPEGQMDEA